MGALRSDRCEAAPPMTDFANAVVSLQPPDPGGSLILGPTRNLITGQAKFQKIFGAPTSLEEDLLTVASAVFASDLANPRGERERYTRRLYVTIPVVNFQAFLRVKEDVEHALFLLSNDSWEITFEPRRGQPEGQRDWVVNTGTTLLFSGGLDSLTQAIALAESGEQAFLVSHDSGNPVVADSQRALAQYVVRLPTARLRWESFRVGARTGGGLQFPPTHEPSQRARSFLFLALAALVARRSGHGRIVFIAENGQMAIHVPLTAARIGAFSTHTAHPEVISTLQNVFQQLLGTAVQIENPYLYSTKAEVVSPLCTGHREVLGRSVSCWRSSRLTGGWRHCGECVPCLVRRIALEFNGVEDREWSRDLFTQDIAALPESDTGKRNYVELAEFVRNFGSTATDADLAFRYPDLVSEYFDQCQATGMYRRFAAEAQSVLAKYPSAARIIA